MPRTPTAGPAPAPPARPPRPVPRGAVSDWLLGHLVDPGTSTRPPDTTTLDVLGEDAQLALYCIHELAYRGLDGVSDRMERDPAVEQLGRELDDAFEQRVRESVGPVDPDPSATLAALSSGDGPSLSGWILSDGHRWHLEEFLVHRSGYQLKEADPHSWGLPRLTGPAKSAFVEIQMDEYGGGRPGLSHAELFATTLGELGIDATYGAHIDRLPAETLATTNLISTFGRSRRLLAALVGHLALFEMTSVGPMARYSEAIGRVGGSAAARRFYDVHVAADAHHGPLAAGTLVPGMLGSDPGAGPEISFGAQALAWIEGRFTSRLLGAWAADRSSLRPAAPVPLSR